MYWAEILFGFYVIVALITGVFVFLKLLSDIDELLAFSFLEKVMLMFIWLVVAGAIGISWPLVAVVAIVPRAWKDGNLGRY